MGQEGDDCFMGCRRPFHIRGVGQNFKLRSFRGPDPPALTYFLLWQRFSRLDRKEKGKSPVTIALTTLAFARSTKAPAKHFISENNHE